MTPSTGLRRNSGIAVECLAGELGGVSQSKVLGGRAGSAPAAPDSGGDAKQPGKSLAYPQLLQTNLDKSEVTMEFLKYPWSPQVPLSNPESVFVVPGGAQSASLLSKKSS